MSDDTEVMLLKLKRDCIRMFFYQLQKNLTKILTLVRMLLTLN